MHQNKNKINTFNNSFIVLPFLIKFILLPFFVKKFILLLKYILYELFNVYYHYKIMIFMIHVPKKKHSSLLKNEIQ
jgi:hypothetical protein